MRFILMLSLAVIALSSAALAQDAPDVADRGKRIELAKEMHKIRPARVQVQSAVDEVSRNLPPMDRDRFLKMAEKAFDYDALEKLSVDAMADLYTVAELQKMVDYFGSPEAKTIEEKMPRYQEKLQPEIIRMLDSAIIAERTGNAAPPPAATPQ